MLIKIISGGQTGADLLHIQGSFARWDENAAGTYCDCIARLAGQNMTEMIPMLLETGTRRLTLELLKRQLEEQIHPENLASCPVCQTLINNLMSVGNDDFQVRIDMKRPVIGIGAPIGFFLPRAAKAILPEDADVANAIGAITSDVVIHRQIRISPGQQGGFSVEGVVGTRQFTDFAAADVYAKDILVKKVRDLGLAAGTSCRTVTLSVKDKLPKTAYGDPIFMERIIQATLTGRPDRVIKQAVPA